MDKKLRDETAPIQSEKVDGILIGKLIQAVENNTVTTSALCRSVDELKTEQTRVALTFEHINRDIIEIRKCAEGKPNKKDIIVIIDERLSAYGLEDVHESTRDMNYVRDHRKGGAVIKQRLSISIISFLIVGALAWGGTAMYEKVKADFKQTRDQER